jgi:hypothetical protein
MIRGVSLTAVTRGITLDFVLKCGPIREVGLNPLYLQLFGVCSAGWPYKRGGTEPSIYLQLFGVRALCPSGPIREVGLNPLYLQLAIRGSCSLPKDSGAHLAKSKVASLPNPAFAARR